MKLCPVVLSYNHPELTTRCVESVLAHFGAKPVILVHNGSQKGSEDILRSRFPQIQHLVIEENRGFSGGANVGIREAFSQGARAVLFLTNDTTLEKIPNPAVLNETLQRKLAVYKSENRGFLLAPRIERRQTGKIDSLGGRVNLFSGKLEHLQFFEDQVSENFYVPGTAFIMNREAWEKVGPFDEALGTYWEDVDLSLRARKLGVRLGVAPEVVLRHGVGKTCHKSPLYSVYYFHRNQRKVVWRHGRRINQILFSFYYGASTLGKTFKFLKNKDISRLKWLLKSVLS